MYYSKIKSGVFTICILVLLSACSNDSAELLYATNDAEAELFYEDNLKVVLEEKCISCHNFHQEGSTNYNSFQKTKDAITFIMGRINSTDNSAMPPRDETDLTIAEKQQFQDFLEILNNDETVTMQKEPVTISWTAFKYPNFDDRVGVSGTFDSLTYKLNDDYINKEDILKDATITIATESVNVGNEPERTTNVGRFFSFFTPTIEGAVKSYTADNVTIEFTMNGITRTSVLDLTINEDTLIMEGMIDDLSIFNWKEGHDALADVCAEHHQNKLWPDIKIKAEIVLPQ